MLVQWALDEGVGLSKLNAVYLKWKLSMKSYITTPIYYVNAAPHIGHAHTTIMADILKRNRRAQAIETKLTTGCDEHGQKNQQVALASGLPVAEYLTMRSKEFQRAFDMLSVEYDYFVRTSRPYHMDQVAKIEQRLMDAGLVTKKQYSGIYCTGCEQFKKPSDLDEDGRCPDHPSLATEQIDELNYFFRIEPYRERLLRHIEEHPDFVHPAPFKLQLLNMLSEPLEDLCISRPKRRVSLGVPLPFDPAYVTYVWFDALINYLTNLNWPNEEYVSWWETAEHLIGKDILKTHGIYWPIMLMAIGEQPPRRLTVHSHWVGSGGIKMSKTLGNVVDPVDVVNRMGADALRYYLARNMRAESDSQVSLDLIRQTYNSELANKIGNLLSRSAKFAKSRFNNRIPNRGLLGSDDERVRRTTLSAAGAFARVIDLPEIPRLMENLLLATESMNNYFAEQAPWDLIKSPETEERCQTVIYVTLDCLRILFEALVQIIPVSAEKALNMLNGEPTGRAQVPWTPVLDRLQPNSELGSIETLFPRIEGL